MTYVAYGPLGPKPALAISHDTVNWRRLGPLHFAYQPELDTDLNLFPNKDIVFFPEPVTGPDGRAAIALLHRPMWDLDWLRPGEGARPPAGIDDDRPSIWIGYIDLEASRRTPAALTTVHSSSMIVAPEMAYETARSAPGRLRCGCPRDGSSCTTESPVPFPRVSSWLTDRSTPPGRSCWTLTTPVR